MESLHSPSARTVRWAAGVLAAAAFAPLAAHATLTAASSICTGVSSYGSNVGNYCAHGDDVGQSAPGTAIGGTGTGSSVGAYQSLAGALQDYGVFHGYAVSAQSGFASVGEAQGRTAAANGRFTDQLTVGGSTGFGYLTFTWSVNGTIVIGGGDSAYGLLEIYTVANGKTDDAYITRSGEYTTIKIPFTFGTAFDLNVSSTVTASSGFDAQPAGHAYSTYAAADFSDTSTLTAITAYDVNGRVIDDISITSASGTTYPRVADDTPPGDPGTPAPLPEPAAWLLMGAGLAGFVCTRRPTGGPGLRGGMPLCA